MPFACSVQEQWERRTKRTKRHLSPLSSCPTTKPREDARPSARIAGAKALAPKSRRSPLYSCSRGRFCQRCSSLFTLLPTRASTYSLLYSYIDSRAYWTRSASSSQPSSSERFPCKLTPRTRLLLQSRRKTPLGLHPSRPIQNASFQSSFCGLLSKKERRPGLASESGAPRRTEPRARRDDVSPAATARSERVWL